MRYIAFSTRSTAIEETMTKTDLHLAGSAAHGRRSFFKKAAGALTAGFLVDETLEALPQNTNTNSKPTDLKITDLRVAT